MNVARRFGAFPSACDFSLFEGVVAEVVRIEDVAGQEAVVAVFLNLPLEAFWV